MAQAFFGGVHPNDMKAATNEKAIEQLEAPAEVVIPMSMHIGAPCKPIVAVGDKVTIGQKIGEPGGFVSAPIHASVSGTVKAVEPRPFSMGGTMMSVVIENDFQNTVCPDIHPVEDPDSLTPEQLVEIVKNAGIVGQGGATFPTHVKISSGLGPVYGVVISFMKNLLHIVIKGTSTACVGELCNFMLGAVFSAVAGVVYKHHKSRKTAIIGAIAGAAAMAVFSVPSNYFITYPAYVQFYHMPLEAILGMYQAILPSADSLIKCLVIFNMPFTLVKGLLDAVLCMLIYKPLSPILHGRK